MDLNADMMQSTYDTFSSAGEVSTMTAGTHSMAQPVMASQALMPGLFAFQSLTPCSAVQPHTMSYVLPTSSHLLTDCSASTLAAWSGTTSTTVNSSLQSIVTPIVQSGGMAGMTRPPAAIPGAAMQPSASVYTQSNRVGYFTGSQC